MITISLLSNGAELWIGVYDTLLSLIIQLNNDNIDTTVLIRLISQVVVH
jgi:hypothetical protein